MSHQIYDLCESTFYMSLRQDDGCKESRTQLYQPGNKTSTNIHFSFCSIWHLNRPICNVSVVNTSRRGELETRIMIVLNKLRRCINKVTTWISYSQIKFSKFLKQTKWSGWVGLTHLKVGIFSCVANITLERIIKVVTLHWNS